MKISKKFRDIVAAMLLIAGCVLISCVFGQLHVSGDTRPAARKLTRQLERQTTRLEGFMQDALMQDSNQWLELDGLPDDMLIYRYCSDTLQSWVNEFPIANDDIRLKVLMPFVSNPRAHVYSPLALVGNDFRYIEMGQKWYLARSMVSDHVRVIGAIEVVSSQLPGQVNSVNPRFNLKEEFTVRPLVNNGGTPVYIDGQPQFQVICENLSTTHSISPVLVWMSLSFIIFSVLLFLSTERNLRRLRLSLILLTVILITYYILGKNFMGQFDIFSPVLYAGNDILYSLGSVIIINLLILVISLCLYMTRAEIRSSALRDKKGKVLLFVAVIAAIAFILAYTQGSLRSIIQNSGLSLELYKLSELTPFCILVYASYISVLLSVPMLLSLLGLKAFSIPSRLTFAVLIAAYLVLNSSVLGFEKEAHRLEVLANRLSFDRDVALEFQLRRIENQIADDMIISALSVFHNTESSIQSRISENYLMRNNQDYTVTAYVFNKGNNTRASANLYSSLFGENPVPISEGSRFLYVHSDGGHPYYLGVFFYLIEGSGLSRVLVKIESDEVQSTKGYAGIFGISPPGRATIPSGYSYARYDGNNLKSYKGSFAYPLEMDPITRARIFDGSIDYTTNEGYTHFFNVVGDNEVIILSREKVQMLTYVVSAMFIAIIVFLMMSVMVRKGRSGDEKLFDKSYYRNRISLVLMVSLISTLLLMASVSVIFVYSRNDANMRNVMYDKIVSIMSMIQDEVGNISNTRDMDQPTVHKLLEQVAADTNSDITLYSPSGRLIMSTAPMVFNRQLIDQRIDGKAYGKIIHNRNSYFIQKERMAMVNFYCMYAPLVNQKGEVLGIISSPYNEDNYDFEEDAVMHSMTIVSLFLVFLIVALFVVSSVVDKMFKPLSEMSRKMKTTGVDSLEQIEYDRDDEVSSIVKAYNGMVTQLQESTRRLAQAERDKAWSEMARQVAHEIKNPLTPMKLQLQRVIRLKEKGNPLWPERFEEASKVLLDHIDVLTDTANEFSTFAKLYSEESIPIHLDKLLREEISLFDNRDNLTIEYIGLDDVVVMGPKPQLTRVFVNMLNNAVQAIGEQEGGRIMVSLRKSADDSCYDIVFEDNGPGVSEDNVDKLFTPNFTTKSSGSGLGLAISRSILERCGATIRYSRSFTLGGACFTIVYPK